MAFRCTITREDIQSDLNGYQVDFDTGERVSSPLKEIPNVKGAKAYVHSGFNNIYKRYQAELLELIKKHKPRLVLLCGHSLGGCVATIMAMAMAELRDSLLPSVDAFGCYVFGTPRIGNGKLDERVRSTPRLIMWRVANEADNIAQLPLRVSPNFRDPENSPFFFEHAGQVFQFDENRGSWNKSHSLQVYINHMNALSAPQ